MEKRIRQELEESIRVKEGVIESLIPQIAAATCLIADAFKNGKKLILFGNGGSAADAQHIACELVGRFEKDRRALPAIALSTNTSNLTAISNDCGFEATFFRQLEALAAEGDVVLGISTSGESPNVLSAFRVAKERGLKTIALTGKGGGKLKDLADIPIIVPSASTARIQEAHITIGHIICRLVEAKLFPNECWAVFIDRDGTLNNDIGYVADPEKLSLLPRAAEAIKLLNAAGARVIVVSNQSGVARGFLSEEAVRRVNQRLKEIVLEQGAAIDAFYFCPHHPDVGDEAYRLDCSCRKPKPGLLLQAAREHNIDLSRSYMVGDEIRDIEAGINAGCKTILLEAGRRAHMRPGEPGISPDHIAADLYEAARWILQERESECRID